MPVTNDYFRVTNIEYEVAELAADNFYSTQHVIVLPEDLKPDYYVQLDSSNQPAAAHRPDRMGFRVIADPFGTGDLAESGAPNVIVVETGVAVSRAPRLHITLVECLKPSSEHGFRLRDVVLIDHPAPSVSGGHQVVSTATVSNVGDVGQVTVHGIQSGFGMTAQGGNSYLPNLMFAAEMMTSSTELTIKRYSAFGTAGGEADGFQSAHGIIEWGAAWTVNSKTGVLGGGFNGSNAGTGQTIHAAGFDYIPSQTMFFPTFSAQHNVDDINFNGMMLLPHDTSIIYGGTGEIPNPDATKSSFAMCSWVNGVQFESNIQAVSHPNLRVEHTMAILNDELGDITAPATLTVTGPANGGETDSTGVLGANIQQGERALSYTFQGEATNTADDNASLVIGLHFNSDTEIELYGADNSNPGSAVDVAVQIADFGAIAVALYEEPPEYTDSNSATNNNYFLFPSPFELVTSSTSESGVDLGHVETISTTRGSLRPQQSGTPTDSLKGRLQFSSGGRSGIAKYAWREQDDTLLVGANHPTFMWGGREILDTHLDVQCFDACFSRFDNAKYYAVMGSAERTAMEIKVYKKDETDAIYDEPTLVSTLDIGTSIDEELLQVDFSTGTTLPIEVQFSMTEHQDGRIYMAVFFSYTMRSAITSVVRTSLSVYSKDVGSADFRLVNNELFLNSGLSSSEFEYADIQSIRIASSGPYIKMVWGDPAGIVHSLTSQDSGATFDYIDETSGLGEIYGGSGTPWFVPSSTFRDHDRCLHDLVGVSDGSGTFLYTYVQNVGGSNFRYGVARSYNMGGLRFVQGSTSDTDCAPLNISACEVSGALQVIIATYTTAVSSGKSTAFFGMIRYPDNNLTSPVVHLTEDFDTGNGAIVHGCGVGTLANMRSVDAWGRCEVSYCVNDNNNGSFKRVGEACLGGWSTHPVNVASDAVNEINPLSMMQYFGVMGKPGEYTNFGGNKWNVGSGAVTSIQNGALTMTPTSFAGKNFEFVSAVTGQAFSRAASFGGTVKLSAATGYMLINANDTSGYNGYSLKVEFSTSSGFRVLSWNGSTYIQEYASGALDSKVFQFSISYNGTDEKFRFLHRSLSDSEEYKGWTDSGQLQMLTVKVAATSQDEFNMGCPSYAGIGSPKVQIFDAWCTVARDNHLSAVASNDVQLYAIEGDDRYRLNGKIATGLPTYIKNGVRLHFTGASATSVDDYKFETRASFAKENVLESSPSIAWRSSDDSSENTLVIQTGGGSLSRMSVHDGIAMFNTNFRQAFVEYSGDSTFSSISDTKTLYSDITSTLTVDSVSGNVITVQAGSEMTRG